MAIVAALVVPDVRQAACRHRAALAARQLAAGLRPARSEAVAQRRETFLVLDLEGTALQGRPDPQEYALPSSVELKLFTAQKDLVDDKVGSIRFFPDGGSNGGRITVASGERKYEVDVDWLTGRVAILDSVKCDEAPSHVAGLSRFRARACFAVSSGTRRTQPARAQRTRLFAARSARRVRHPGARRDGAVPPLRRRAAATRRPPTNGAARAGRARAGSPSLPPRCRCAREPSRAPKTTAASSGRRASRRTSRPTSTPDLERASENDAHAPVSRHASTCAFPAATRGERSSRWRRSSSRRATCNERARPDAIGPSCTRLHADRAHDRARAARADVGGAVRLAQPRGPQLGRAAKPRRKPRPACGWPRTSCARKLDAQHPQRMRKIVEFPLLFGGERDELRYAATLPAACGGRRHLVLPPHASHARRHAFAAGARADDSRPQRARHPDVRQDRALGARRGHQGAEGAVLRPRPGPTTRSDADVARPLGRHATAAAARFAST